MPFSVAFLLVTLALIFVVFWLVRGKRGLVFALAASTATLVGMGIVFIMLVTIITSSMP